MEDVEATGQYIHLNQECEQLEPEVAPRKHAELQHPRIALNLLAWLVKHYTRNPFFHALGMAHLRGCSYTTLEYGTFSDPHKMNRHDYGLLGVAAGGVAYTMLIPPTILLSDLHAATVTSYIPILICLCILTGALFASWLELEYLRWRVWPRLMRGRLLEQLVAGEVDFAELLARMPGGRLIPYKRADLEQTLLLVAQHLDLFVLRPERLLRWDWFFKVAAWAMLVGVFIYGFFAPSPAAIWALSIPSLLLLYYLQLHSSYRRRMMFDFLCLIIERRFLKH